MGQARPVVAGVGDQQDVRVAEAVVSRADPPTAPPEHDPSPDWGPSLSCGAVGIALLHLARTLTGLAEWNTAHRWVAVMTRGPVGANPDACLCRGAPAVAFVLRTADRSSCTAAIDSLDRPVTALVRRHLEAAHQRVEQGLMPRLRETPNSGTPEFEPIRDQMPALSGSVIGGDVAGPSAGLPEVL